MLTNISAVLLNNLIKILNNTIDEGGLLKSGKKLRNMDYLKISKKIKTKDVDDISRIVSEDVEQKINTVKALQKKLKILQRDIGKDGISQRDLISKTKEIASIKKVLLIMRQEVGVSKKLFKAIKVIAEIKATEKVNEVKKVKNNLIEKNDEKNIKGRVELNTVDIEKEEKNQLRKKENDKKKSNSDKKIEENKKEKDRLSNKDNTKSDFAVYSLGSGSPNKAMQNVSLFSPIVGESSDKHKYDLAKRDEMKDFQKDKKENAIDELKIESVVYKEIIAALDEGRKTLEALSEMKDAILSEATHPSSTVTVSQKSQQHIGGKGSGVAI